MIVDAPKIETFQAVAAPGPAQGSLVRGMDKKSNSSQNRYRFLRRGRPLRRSPVGGMESAGGYALSGSRDAAGHDSRRSPSIFLQTLIFLINDLISSLSSLRASLRS